MEGSPPRDLRILDPSGGGQTSIIHRLEGLSAPFWFLMDDVLSFLGKPNNEAQVQTMLSQFFAPSQSRLLNGKEYYVTKEGLLKVCNLKWKYSLIQF